MRAIFSHVLTLLAIIGLASSGRAQQMQRREVEFLRTAPRVGEQLPNVAVFNLDGTPFDTADLRGHYTVLTFGCLT